MSACFCVSPCQCASIFGVIDPSLPLWALQCPTQHRSEEEEATLGQIWEGTKKPCQAFGLGVMGRILTVQLICASILLLLFSNPQMLQLAGAGMQTQNHMCCPCLGDPLGHLWSVPRASSLSTRGRGWSQSCRGTRKADTCLLPARCLHPLRAMAMLLNADEAMSGLSNLSHFGGRVC